MRQRTKAGLTMGGALAGTAAVIGMCAMLFTSGVVIAPQRAAAADLEPFDSCPQLLDWYVEHNLDQVGPYGWAGDLTAYADVGFARDAAAMPMPVAAEVAGRTSAKAVTNSPTGTNVQETGVDEPDIVKTDGSLFVRVLDGNRVQISDVTGEQPRVLATHRLPKRIAEAELLLVGDHVVVVASVWQDIRLPRPTDTLGTVSRIAMPMAPTTRLIDLDISTPEAPRVVADHTYSGRSLGARQYGDVVRLVTSTGRPDLPFVQPSKRGGAKVTRHHALERNRSLVRESRIEDWLPSVRDNLAGGDAEPLLDCDQVLHATDFTGSDTITVTGFRPGSASDRSSTAVTTAGDLVYSSTDAVYVAATRYPAAYWRGPARLQDSADLAVPMSAPEGTDVHAFALDGAGARYQASGHLDGTIRDRWSMDEHDGTLRLAVSWPNRRGVTDQNGVVVLAREGDRLVRKGELRGLGIKEEIKSVRWFDDLAVLVTFRQMDPLYTVDLSDPATPRALGALKIPGFSSYLHPIGDDLLLGLGTDADRRGRDLGAQAAVFDVSDLHDPQRLSVVGFGPNTGLRASEEPRAFTWLPERSAAITVLDHWDRDRPSIELLTVADGKLTVRDLGTDRDWNLRAVPLPDDRVALAGQTLRLLDLDR